MSYPEQAHYIASMLAREPLSHVKCDLVVDATGVGLPDAIRDLQAHGVKRRLAAKAVRVFAKHGTISIEDRRIVVTLAKSASEAANYATDNGREAPPQDRRADEGSSFNRIDEVFS
jgi:hypothetical protein